MNSQPLKKKDSRRRDIIRRGACFLCGDTNGFVTAYSGIKTNAGAFDVEVCRGCGFQRTEPFLDEAEMNRIYSHLSYREADATRFYSPLEKVITWLRTRRAALVERFASKVPRSSGSAILDVGCGRADFLSMMASKGWKTTGLELDRRAISRAKKKGMDLRVGDLVSTHFPDGQFDAVTFYHVFEHVRDPIGTLKECARILKPGGLLLIAVPNTASLQARVTGRHWFHLDPPYHLYHYSLENLKTLLAGAHAGAARDSFKVVSVSHFSLEYNPFGWIQSICNMLGFPANMLYDFLRGKTKTDFQTRFSIALIFMTLLFVVPLSLFLTVFEAAIGMGGTIEVYAKKKD